MEDCTFVRQCAPNQQKFEQGNETPQSHGTGFRRNTLLHRRKSVGHMYHEFQGVCSR